MKLKTIEITSENILSFEPYIADDHIRAIVQKDTGAIGLLTESMRSCGALFYRLNEDEGSVFVESLFVDEGVRLNGGGKLLMEALYEKEKDEYPDVVVRILPESEKLLKPFLDKMEYDEYVSGEWIFDTESVDIEEWSRSSYGKKCQEYAKQYSQSVMTIDKAKGTVSTGLPEVFYDSDISYVLEDGGEKGYILATRSGKHDILINDINIASQRDNMGGALLFIALRAYAYVQKDLGTTHLITASKEIKDMWNVFFPKAAMSQVIYAKKDLSGVEEDIVIRRETFSIPRLNTISKMLDDAKIPAFMSYDEENGHTIYLDREDGKKMVLMRNPWASYTVKYIEKNNTLEAKAEEHEAGGMFWIEMNHLMNYIGDIDIS